MGTLPDDICRRRILAKRQKLIRRGNNSRRILGPTFSPGIVAGEGIPYEHSPTTILRRQVTGESHPQRQVVGESLDLSLGKALNVVVSSYYDVSKYIHEPASDTTTSNHPPLIPEELKVDKIVLSWIFSALSDKLQQRLVVARLKSAKEAWDLIADIVKDYKRSRTSSLKAELRSITLDDLSMDAYFGKIESLMTILASLDSLVNDKDVVHYALEEMRLKCKALALPVDSSSPMVLMAKSGNTRRSSPTTQVKSWRPCFNFAKGACQFGDSCRYVHDANVRVGGTNNGSNRGHGTNDNTTNELLQKLVQDLGAMNTNVTVPNPNNSRTPAVAFHTGPPGFTNPTGSQAHPPGFLAAHVAQPTTTYPPPTGLYSTQQAQVLQPNTIVLHTLQQAQSLPQPAGTTCHPNVGPTALSDQPTTIPHAFNIETLQDPNSDTWNMDTCASSHLNASSTYLSNGFNTCLYSSVSVGDGHTPSPIRAIDFTTRRVLLRCDNTRGLYPATSPSPIPQAHLDVADFKRIWNLLHGDDIRITKRHQSIERFLNNFSKQPNETNMNDLESDDESVDTPLVSPFPHSDNDSDDGEVLNELIEYANIGMLRREKAINSFNRDDLAFQCMIRFRKFVAYFDSFLPMNIIMRKAYNTIMVEGLESTGKNLVAVVRDVYVFAGSFTYITNFVVLEDIGEFILIDKAEVVMGKPFRKITKLKYDCTKGLMPLNRIYDNYTFHMPRTILRMASMDDGDDVNDKLNLELRYIAKKVVKVYANGLKRGVWKTPQGSGSSGSIRRIQLMDMAH
nr:hypothetical protein [Tanacetum cinerariifolium]